MRPIPPCNNDTQTQVLKNVDWAVNLVMVTLFHSNNVVVVVEEGVSSNKLVISVTKLRSAARQGCHFGIND